METILAIGVLLLMVALQPRSQHLPKHLKSKIRTTAEQEELKRKVLARLKFTADKRDN